MEKIFYVLERIYKMNRIPVRYFNPTGEMTLFYKGYDPVSDPLICDEELQKNMIQKAAEQGFPILEFEENYLYGGYRDSLGNIFVFGPVSTTAVTQEQVEHYRRSHKIKRREKDFFIKRRTLEEMCAALSMLAFSITGEEITELDIISYKKKSSKHIEELQKNNVMQYEFEFVEQESPRFNFSEEMLFMKHIQEGNVDALLWTAWEPPL